jgi:hypothetical protein
MILLTLYLFQGDLEFDTRHNQTNPAASSIGPFAQFKPLARIAAVFEGLTVAGLSAAAPADTRCRNITTRTRFAAFAVFRFHFRISFCFQCSADSSMTVNIYRTI